ncbi:unnamed protein product [Cyclocybe aegerita]|uniref:Uncharacterized protein n=1 Tax=Cyclocybe aegerita TaxID=1973307 RepID=A0A8S0XZ17_CYCAE|nr:unnamed protein product [Cyclocybe aegerita]
MPTASPEFDRTSLRIRTLTATLRKMQQAERPQSTRSEVVAVTGAIEETGVKTLVVVHNASSGRGPQPFSLQGRNITKNDELFDAIISGPGSARLEEHISDLLGLLSCCDPTGVVKIEDFSAFVTMRSIQKLYSRLVSDKENWHLRVHETLKVWVPDEGDSSLKTLWVKKPRWAGHFPDDSAARIKRGAGQSEEWEFSPTTAPRWEYRGSPGADKLNPLQPQTNRSKQDVQNTLREINSISYSLYTFVNQSTEILKMLLAQKSLEKVFSAQKKTGGVDSAIQESSKAPNVTDEHNEIPGGVNSSTEESSNRTFNIYIITLANTSIKDEDSELALETEETEGDCVYRYLQAIVAWQAALEVLLQPRYRNALSNISVGMVEVVGSEFGLMQADEFVKEYFARPSVPTKAEVREILKPDIPTKFNGTVHIEATLMGLLTYFSHQGNASDYARDIFNIDILKESIEPIDHHWAQVWIQSPAHQDLVELFAPDSE